MTTIKGIKNLLFDQGGVIVDIERDRCLDELRLLGMEAPERLIGLYKPDGPFFALENGDITIKESCASATAPTFCQTPTHSFWKA